MQHVNVKRLLKRTILHTGILRWFNIHWPVTVNGTHVKIPIVGQVGFSNLTQKEPWMVEVLSRVLSVRQGIFIDAGANLGQTLVKVKSINPDILYLGFEPNPQCVPYVNHLIRANSFRNCVLIPVGLFNQSGIRQLDFFTGDTASGGASFVKRNWSVRQAVGKLYVPVFSLDTILSDLGLTEVIGIIKIDVEGAELEVLEGLHEVMAVHRPLLIMEILPVHSEQDVEKVQRQTKIEQILAALDYEIFQVKKKAHSQYAGLQRLAEFGVHGNFVHRDYIFIPAELTEEMTRLLDPFCE